MTYEDIYTSLAASRNDGVYKRINAEHPVDIMLGYDGHSRSIMVICPTRPPQAPMLASMAVTTHPRDGGKWALVIRLLRPELKQLFNSLATDLEEATRAKPSAPGEVVIARLLHWQRLLMRGTAGGLSSEALCGLVGELLFLNEAMEVLGPREAVLGWRGPYDAPRDFIFDRCEVEVKALSPRRERVTISSLAQLSDGGAPLFLCTRHVALQTSPSDHTISLVSLVQKSRSAVLHDVESSERLEAALQAAGWDDRQDLPEGYVIAGLASIYRVDSDFPRLQRSDIPAAITDCSYDISLPGIASHRVSTWSKVTP